MFFIEVAVFLDLPNFRTNPHTPMLTYIPSLSISHTVPEIGWFISHCHDLVFESTIQESTWQWEICTVDVSNQTRGNLQPRLILRGEFHESPLINMIHQYKPLSIPLVCWYTVDGRKPAPVHRWFIPLFCGFQHCFNLSWCRISQPSTVNIPVFTNDIPFFPALTLKNISQFRGRKPPTPRIAGSLSVFWALISSSVRNVVRSPVDPGASNR